MQNISVPFGLRRRIRRVLCLFLTLVSVLGCLTGCGSTTKKDYDYQFSQPAQGDTIAIIHTSLGDITMRFFPEEAPKAVENFISLSQSGYYDGVEFFRVIEDFMIQTGDPTGSGKGGESSFGSPFEDEICPYLSTYYGAVCMANMGAYTGTNTSQFFIVTCSQTDITNAQRCNDKAAKAEKVDQAKLDKFAEKGGAIWLDSQVSVLYESNYQYTASVHTVFGQVLSGMEVAEAISRVETYSQAQVDDANIDDPGQTKIMLNKPRDPVLIESIEITTYGKG